MKKVLAFVFAAATFSAHAAFIHPLDFDGSDAQQKEVANYIQEKVKSDYCNNATVNVCEETTMRMVEEENMKAFKELTKAKDRPVLDKVITDFCHGSVNMCHYIAINAMYQQTAKNAE